MKAGTEKGPLGRRISWIAVAVGAAAMVSPPSGLVVESGRSRTESLSRGFIEMNREILDVTLAVSVFPSHSKFLLFFFD
jgi:hypothetical protein